MLEGDTEAPRGRRSHPRSHSRQWKGFDPQPGVCASSAWLSAVTRPRLSTPPALSRPYDPTMGWPLPLRPRRGHHEGRPPPPPGAWNRPRLCRNSGTVCKGMAGTREDSKGSSSSPRSLPFVAAEPGARSSPPPSGRAPRSVAGSSLPQLETDHRGGPDATGVGKGYKPGRLFSQSSGCHVPPGSPPPGPRRPAIRTLCGRRKPRLRSPRDPSSDFAPSATHRVTLGRSLPDPEAPLAPLRAGSEGGKAYLTVRLERLPHRPLA